MVVVVAASFYAWWPIRGFVPWSAIFGTGGSDPWPKWAIECGRNFFPGGRMVVEPAIWHSGSESEGSCGTPWFNIEFAGWCARVHEYCSVEYATCSGSYTCLAYDAGSPSFLGWWWWWWWWWFPYIIIFPVRFPKASHTESLGFPNGFRAPLPLVPPLGVCDITSWLSNFCCCLRSHFFGMGRKYYAQNAQNPF